ncbi:unnamed protein product [Plasmodium vivax]|uniref:(malaria parasite P. vivax) hypothetical protein n=1 Tax=Plasmodium vivax TaxID=5855 RepID=A0A8S4HIG6_PLAVI|nr:unnamed protein product [Plasmodium vivax]
MSNYLGDKKLGLLRTKYNYGKLDSGWDICQKDAFYNKAKTELDRNDGLQDVSDNILKALCYVYKKSLIDNFESDICKFLYFWLGNILLDKMRNKFVFFDVIRDIFDILKNHKGKICTAPTYHIDVENFKNIKLFFDYSEDYDSYDNQITVYNQPCNNNYKKYLQKYVDTYNKFHGICQNEPHSYAYCDVFNEYFNGKNAYDLSNWKCDLQEHGHEEQELEDEKVAQESPLSPGLGKGVHHEKNPKEFPNVIGQKEERPGSPGYPSGEGTPFLNDTLYPADDPTPSTIKKSITSAVSAAGVLVPPFLVYHYTPAGTWLSKLLGRNKGPTRNPYANQEIMADFSMPGDFYSERNRYNIMYRPE